MSCSIARVRCAVRDGDGAVERGLQQTAALERRVGRDRHDLGARRHHLPRVLLRELEDAGQQPRVGAVGPRLLVESPKGKARILASETEGVGNRGAYCFLS